MGNIFNIQRFSIDDGPGVRTTVFLKGCPLNCVWCHNPESKEIKPQLMYHPDKCIGCFACVNKCKNGLHKNTNGTHFFNRSGCIDCGECVVDCFVDALEICGKAESAAEIIETAKRDREFYDKSGGGLTISGGEPLLQPKFALEIAKTAKENGISVCIETSGYGKAEDLMALAKYTDIFLFDFKLYDDALHKKYVGVSNATILDNLKKLKNSKVILRCPIIPDINLSEEHFNAIADIAKKNTNIIEIDLLPYHPLGISKSESMGDKPLYDNPRFLDKSELSSYAEKLKIETGLPVKL